MSQEIENTSAAVFKINTASGSGSGFYLKNHDIVVTNYHVVSGFKKVAIEKDKNSYVADVIMVNPMLDLAFLKPQKALDVPQINFQEHQFLKSSDKVSVLGYPFGMPFTITEGIISSPKQVLGGQVYIQTDAAVNPGNSGGPVVNYKGDIIGVTTSKFTEADNMGFAVPIDHVRDELELFLKNPNHAFAVKCPSCNYALYEKMEHCPNCGSELKVEELFAEPPKSAIAEFVEDVFKELNLDPVIARKGVDFWEFHQGSALIRYFVYRNSYLFATSPIVKLPKTGLPEIYKYLLSDPVRPFVLGVADGIIYVSYREHLADIYSSKKEQIRKNLAALALKADELDNYLVDTYKCEWTDKSKT